ncbi:unnamed protein product [Trifolium pratense]|uniref:Uncharacterized protein n=1 Tax=Trifolium pratense TaxID=57577 RepID=A0ACB0IHM6_TRIPR|nr:unnamed protein product [Trifolium pratense]
MGGCYSDMKAKEAVGGVNQKATNNNNDAVDFFYTSQGFQPLFTQVEIVTKQNRSLNLKLQSKNGNNGQNNLGTVTIRAEETVSSRSAVEIFFRCSHLDNKDTFSKSDPFLRISRMVESGGTIPICKTEVIDNNLNPKWKPVCLNFQQFGSKVLKGQLFVDQYNEKEQFSFIDYISSGFELNFMVAIDFTASNGDPQKSDSLHYIDVSGRFNSYQQAIMEVGEVIQFYDTDKMFPAWGFGGNIHKGTVSHCFNLNGALGVNYGANSEVFGVEGIMDAYSKALRSVTLSGPTLFGPVINTAAQMAAESLSSYNSTKYYVLLIITDGIVTDLQESINAVVNASDLPLSILIVGVGRADFTSMEVLDADNARLINSTGRVAARDMVQFVPMRKVKEGQISVVQSLLEELPDQFLSFMRSRDIKPLFSHPKMQ